MLKYTLYTGDTKYCESEFYFFFFLHFLKCAVGKFKIPSVA